MNDYMIGLLVGLVIGAIIAGVLVKRWLERDLTEILDNYHQKKNIFISREELDEHMQRYMMDFEYTTRCKTNIYEVSSEELMSVFHAFAKNYYPSPLNERFRHTICSEILSRGIVFTTDGTFGSRQQEVFDYLKELGSKA